MTGAESRPLGRPPAPAGQRGMALIVALWMLGLLSLVAAAFMAESRTEARLARNLVENEKAEALADAGVYRSVAALLDPDPSHRPRVDGTKYQWLFGGGHCLVSIQDETGKIDLNTAADPLLEGLFVSVGTEPVMAKRLVQAIRDFEDPDDMKGAEGAEDPEYEAAGLANGAMDGPFNRVAELQQVLGITRDLYERVAPVLTVYSGSRNIDHLTAPRGALLALPGAKSEQVDAMMDARAQATQTGRNTRKNSADDEVVSAWSDGPASLDDLASPDGDTSIDNAGQDVQDSGVYTVTSTGSTPNGGTFQRWAVVRLTGDPLQPFIFHEWHRGWTSSAAKTVSGEQGP